MPANSVRIFKGIKIYFSIELRENESYREISKVIIDGRSNVLCFQLLTRRYRYGCVGGGVDRGCKHCDEFGFVYVAKHSTCDSHFTTGGFPEVV